MSLCLSINKKTTDVISYILNNKNMYGYNNIYNHYVKNNVITLDIDPIKYNNIDNNNKVKNLMIVAHPDDEIIYGGYDLLKEEKWFVVYCTNAFDRINMVKKTSSLWNFNSLILHYIDSDRAPVLFHYNLYVNLQNIIKGTKWKNVITHNSTGEYGHPQHIKIHKIVSNIIYNIDINDKPKNFKIFSIENKNLPEDLLKKKYETISEIYERPPKKYK